VNSWSDWFEVCEPSEPSDDEVEGAGEGERERAWAGIVI